MRLLVGSLLALLPSTPILAKGDIKVARGIVSTVYKRLASAPPSRADLETWAKQFSDAKDTAAERKVLSAVAKSATSQDTFFSRTVLNYAEPETNEEAEITNSLSDYTALVVGAVRDELDFRQILTGNILYVPNPETQMQNPPVSGQVGRGNGQVGLIDGVDIDALTAVQYSNANNDAFRVLQYNVTKGVVPLADTLVKIDQTPQTTGVAISSGIYTTRGYGSVFYNDGTNRAPVDYTINHYLCTTLEEIADTSRADVFVRRDVDRTPGGDSSKFRQECVGCQQA